jgi:hypothetical protein
LFIHGDGTPDVLCTCIDASGWPQYPARADPPVGSQVLARMLQHFKIGTVERLHAGPMQRLFFAADKLYGVCLTLRLRRALRAILVCSWGWRCCWRAGWPMWLVQDRANHLAAAQRKSLALATGADRLLQLSWTISARRCAAKA